MLPKFDILDVPSPLVNDQQARDFSNRILGGVAKRIAGGEPKDITYLKAGTIIGGLRYRFSFHSERYQVLNRNDYYMSLTTIYPFNDAESSEIISNRTQASSHETTTMPMADKRHEECESEGPTAYLALEHEFTFRMPRSRKVGSYFKTMNLIPLDEEEWEYEDDAEIGYSYDRTTAVNHLDVERLLRFGETAFDTHAYEEELTKITILDLRFMLGAFQSIGLLRRNCQLLSPKVL